MLGGAGTGPMGTMSAGTGLLQTAEVRSYVPFVGDVISRVAPIQFDVADEYAIPDLFITIRYESGSREVVRSEGEFRERFEIGSSLYPIDGGMRCALRRRGGWPHGTLTVEVSLDDPSGITPVN